MNFLKINQTFCFVNLKVSVPQKGFHLLHNSQRRDLHRHCTFPPHIFYFVYTIGRHGIWLEHLKTRLFLSPSNHVIKHNFDSIPKAVLNCV